MSEDSLKYLAEMDPFTLDELMTQHGQEVWNFAYFLTKNRSMADDITQDVFLQVYRHVTSFRGEASIKTWLLKITRNISHNYRNTAFIRKVLLVDVAVSKEYSRSAEQAFLEKETANHVWRQVFNLPVKFREVLVLHAKYELSMSDIAHILKIPEGTVKSRLFGARKKMSALLKEERIINEPI
ncbi:ECF RNA polymerase sigma factor SigM [Paenibacillus plantiphilus]|uniref:RNA polymerase sigma factor n=1 Tax=Paenibacillus plantiphilus TaxID=2905650 RepID=A0ABN8GRV3_9BACL|nr:RNA polymerase sigma factor [Paenibacillus plantiphilus]CAH1216354.1 ECF RNA polymerase sigma factor SigM [Paenibacillus plantiphilus]